uniref:Endonuclease MutS2 n=1 Tax=Chlorobium chlorochromatii (strain CaD3) TaxID=340177 RepID=Q3ASQ5_CHLCH
MNPSTLKKLEFTKIAAYAAQLCLSPMGRDRLLNARPLREREALMAELERVLELRMLLQEGLTLPFSHLPDTRVLLKKLEIEHLALEPLELLDLYHLLYSSVQLRRFMYGNRERYGRLNDLTIMLWMERSLQAMIQRCVDERGLVRDSASDGLLLIRHDLAESRELLRRRMERLLRRASANGWLMEETVAVKNGRLTLALKVEYKYKIPGYIQDYSGTGQTVFIEPAETLETSNRIQDLEISERREVERILQEVSAALRGELENIHHNQQLMAEFDALYARARFAVETNAVLPTVTEGNELRLIKAYHPWLLLSHRERTVQPLDLHLSAEEQVLVISGPNAGGKSVTMKSVGLLCCMLVHGYLLPCSESSCIPLFNNIFIEIGDDQSIEHDLSTFSSHLSAIRSILERAGTRDLVLIDELCGGTDVEEGGAIARAVIEELLASVAKSIVTTHLGDLKAYAHQRDGVVNGAMAFDRAELQPTFRFIKGLPGNSFAFAMMQRMGFSPALVERARHFMAHERIGLEQMVDDLSHIMEEQQRQRQQLDDEQRTFAERERTVLEVEATLKQQQRELKQQISRAVQKEVEHARKEIRAIVQEVKAAPTNPQVVQAAREKLGIKRQEVEERHTTAAPTTASEPTIDRTITIGDMVRLLDTNATGEVERFNGDNVVVRCGTIRLQTHLKNLEKSSKTKARTAQRDTSNSKVRSWSTVTNEVSSTQLDVRGMSGNEAVPHIERFLDTLRLHRIHFATILHGKGTGSLRKRTAECLKLHTAVKSFRLGGLGEGGDGVTIVELGE